MKLAWIGLSAALLLPAGSAIKIQTAHSSDRERQTKSALEQLLSERDLSRYIFTRKIVIEQRAINHAFPELTLNVRFADSPDELMSSFIHEQIHWYLRDHDSQQKAAIADLRRMYPEAPVGGTEGADSLYSTYGHLVDCYLEIEADRKLIGSERTKSVIADKGHYTWIYATILRDEVRIAEVVDNHRLRIE